jgi:hypothetical protein
MPCSEAQWFELARHSGSEIVAHRFGLRSIDDPDGPLPPRRAEHFGRVVARGEREQEVLGAGVVE